MNALEPGSTLGGYRILARLRAGAMGVLYLARRVGPAAFSRPVAVKVIHDHLAQNKRFGRMFIDEAKLSARIDDPNVVRVEEFGQANGRYYLVMEYVHGASLAQTIGVLRKRGRIPVEQAVAIAIQIAGGLHGAHEATDDEGKALGIVHRDVSPHNVLLSFKGSVRVIDFGIAKAREVGGQTKTGSLRGKLAYMPPEQARSARTVDRRADLYGVGLILWEMLTFRRVFDAESDIAILNQIRDPQILPPSSLVPSVPKALDDLVMRMLSNEPNERPATGAAVQRALAEAVPKALLVLPGDLAMLMSKVQAGADAAAGDDADLYGDEVKRTLATYAGSMHTSVDDEVGDAHDTRPSAPESDELPVSPAAPPFLASPRTIEDQVTTRRPVPMRPGVVPSVLLRPSDGVRALAPSSPGPPSLPPPSRSSSPVLAAPPVPAPHPSSPELGRPSYVDARLGHPSSPDSMNGRGGGPLAAGVGFWFASWGPWIAQLEAKQKLLLAVVVPVGVGLGIAILVIVGGSSEPRRPAPSIVRGAPAKYPPSTVSAPVVVAPLEVIEEPDAAPPSTSRSQPRPRPGGGR